jgi:phosphatidyl-myo-inositol alpha-mannosyltransferase
MKIAITNAFLPSDQQSGVPYQVHHLANALSEKGHEVTIFSFSPKPADALYANHQFERPRVPSRFLPFVMAYRLATTDVSDFDVINCHGDNYLFRPQRPVVRTFHGTAWAEMAHAPTLRRRLFFLVTIPLESIGALFADYVVGVSAATRRDLPAVQSLIPCGVDLNAFHPGTKSDRPTVLFVGTEGGRKRGAWLADLFKAKVLPAVPTAELRIVSEARGLEPGVRRYGRLPAPELAELYRSSWAFCLPSTYEGFGVPYVEAMASGTAVVATAPNAGAKEVLSNGTYGAFVSDDRLAAELTRILTDADVRLEMERQGMLRSRDYAWPAIAARYEAIFSDAIAARRTRRALA